MPRKVSSWHTSLSPLRLSLPIAVSTNEVTALVAASFVAAMFILAASAIASGTDEITPSFFLPIAASLPAPGKPQNELGGPLPLSVASASGQLNCRIRKVVGKVERLQTF